MKEEKKSYSILTMLLLLAFVLGMIIATLLVHVGWVHAEWLKIEDMGEIDTVRIWGKDWELLTNGGLKPGKIDSLHVFIVRDSLQVRPQVGLDISARTDSFQTNIKHFIDIKHFFEYLDSVSSDTACPSRLRTCWHWETRMKMQPCGYGQWYDDLCYGFYCLDTCYIQEWFKVYDDCDKIKK